MIVVLALLVAPLALYARGADDAMRDCNGMCCLPHAHSMAIKMAMALLPAPAAEASTAAEPECRHQGVARGSAHESHAAAIDHAQHAASASSSAAELKCALDCATHRAPHSGNFGLLVPIAPTKPSNLVVLRTSIESQRLALAGMVASQQDFTGSPFQPPRA